MKWLRNLLKGASLTGALFAFQACYGTAYSPFYEAGEAPMSFSVVSHRTGQPIPGIKVYGGMNSYGHNTELGVSGEDGLCNVRIPYVKNEFGPHVQFEDPEGLYIPKDTVLVDLRERNIVIKLDEGR